MSGSGEDDRTPELARVTRAAQREFVPDDLDWDRMDEALFAKLDQVRADEAKRERASHRSKFVVVGPALAVAASARNERHQRRRGGRRRAMASSLFIWRGAVKLEHKAPVYFREC